jgi:hypothetical protein
MNKKMKLWMLAGVLAVAAGSGTAMAAGTQTASKTTTQTATQANGDTTKAQAQGEKHERKGMPFFGKDSAELQTLLKLDAAALKQKFEAGKSLLDIAAEQGVSKDQLVAALTKQNETKLAQEVKDGKLTQAKADEMKAQFPNMVQKMIEGKGGEGKFGHGPFDGGKGGGFHGFGKDSGLLDLLKVTEDQFRTAMDAGKTILDLAQEKGVTKEQVVDFVLKQHQTQIDQLVKDGKVTEEQAKQEKAELTADKVAEMISNKGAAHHGHHDDDKQGAQDAADAPDAEQAQTQVQQN